MTCFSIFVFNHKTAYEMLISDWSSDVCSSDLIVGFPQHGAELADDLQRLVDLHGAETIAAVIVEPMAGSTGVLVPPVGYLQRLREICDKHGVILIFDEVITALDRKSVV